jgi:hypothetical protein
MPPRLETEIQSSITPEPNRAVSTYADRATPVSGQSNRASWQRIIDEKLIEWGAHPDFFADANIESPGPEVVSLAIQIAKDYRDTNQAPPQQVVPDGDGGIVFNRRSGSVSEKIHIGDDLTVEYVQMVGAKLVERNRIL